VAFAEIYGLQLQIIFVEVEGALIGGNISKKNGKIKIKMSFLI